MQTLFKIVFILGILTSTPFLYPAFAPIIAWLSNITDDNSLGYFVLRAVAHSVLTLGAFLSTYLLVPYIKELTVKAGLFGRDINKTPGETTAKIPESLGIVPAVVFLIVVVLLQIPAFQVSSHKLDLVEYDAALFCICFMILLGFGDDVLELKWRYKMILPAFASLPLIVAYQGSTMVVVPPPLTWLCGSTVDLGWFYLIYMLLLGIFCTNAINIYAGVNGLEVGQSVVISGSIILHNIMQLCMQSISLGHDAWTAYQSAQLFSLLIMTIFFSVSVGLLMHNWYPSRVFVGDTYTYFSGMTLAVAGILGQQSKTLFLFFLPQVLNFLLSIPQLVGMLCMVDACHD